MKIYKRNVYLNSFLTVVLFVSSNIEARNVISTTSLASTIANNNHLTITSSIIADKTYNDLLKKYTHPNCTILINNLSKSFSITMKESRDSLTKNEKDNLNKIQKSYIDQISAINPKEQEFTCYLLNRKAELEKISMEVDENDLDIDNHN